jgi:hypothetical protein
MIPPINRAYIMTPPLLSYAFFLMMSSSGRKHLVVTLLIIYAVCMPTYTVTFNNTQTLPDNGQGRRFVSEQESEKRWKRFGNTWKGFQNLSTS